MPSAVKQRSRSDVRKSIWAGGIALAALGVVSLTYLPGPFRLAMNALDDLSNDIYYKLRPLENQRDGDVVIVTADEPSMEQFSKVWHHDWPWPRAFWGAIAGYAAHAGAKVVVFDILFEGMSEFHGRLPDDEDFAKAVQNARNGAGDQVPVVFGCEIDHQGAYKPFGPPIMNPLLGVVNIEDTKLYRHYSPSVMGKDSLAAAAIKAAGQSCQFNTAFRLHYYGPGQADSGPKTFTYIPAIDVLMAWKKGDAAAAALGFYPEMLKNKIVLLGSTAAGAYDLKSSPISSVYPGIELHATAIENMLHGQRVMEFPAGLLVMLPLLFAAWASFGVILPRGAMTKLAFPALAAAVLLGLGVILFRRPQIWWLPPAHSLLALLVATPGAFAYSYFVEDRQSRLMLRALKRVVSPAVADELSEDPDKLQRNTRPRLLTMLFTDLANFTSLAESMKQDNQALVALLDDYFEVMSREVIRQDGTLDKYIGDSIMCFWNAPTEQADHAVRACRAALAMNALRKEFSIPSKQPGIADQKVFTRFGIHTAVANYGFVGSSNLMNYTVLGDGVNLASRLEGANKLYGTRILISQDTANLVRSCFELRKVDRLRVKGKQQSIEVFELLAEQGCLDERMTEVVERYHTAFAAYQEQHWQHASEILLESEDRFGEDLVSRALLNRIEALRGSPPARGWDGAFGALEK